MTTPEPSRADFEQWWSEQGQFSRAGGGDYEKTFAFNAWQAAMAHKGADCWQSIETAPKDGTRVLLTAMQDKPIAGAGNWVERHKIWLWPYPLVEPTHWASLPAAPKQEGST